MADKSMEDQSLLKLLGLQEAQKLLALKEEHDKARAEAEEKIAYLTNQFHQLEKDRDRVAHGLKDFGAKVAAFETEKAAHLGEVRALAEKRSQFAGEHAAFQRVKSDVEARESWLLERDSKLRVREDAVAKKEADVDRRLALIKQAM